jgi:hypothetical protein
MEEQASEILPGPAVRPLLEEADNSRYTLNTTVTAATKTVTFPRNHREAIAEMDFFTVPTITFGLLYGFLVIAHDRRTRASRR